MTRLLPSRRGLPRVLAALAALVLVGTVLGSAGASAEGGSLLMIRRINSIDPANTRLQFLYTGPSEDVSSTQLSENGVPVDIAKPERLPGTAKTAVAMIFDTSEAADTSGLLVNAKDAAKTWIRNRNTEQKSSQVIALYTASDKGVMIHSFTSDEERLLNSIDRIAANNDPVTADSTALWSALKLAATDLGNQGNYQSNVVIMTAQNDNVTGKDEVAARGQLITSQAAVFALAYTGGGMTTNALQTLVDTTGGEVLSTGDAASFGDLVGQVDTTLSSQQYEILYPSTVPQSAVANIELKVGESLQRATVVVGGDVMGKQALEPRVTSSSGGIAFLQGGIGLVVAVLLMLLAVTGVIYSLVLIITKDDALAGVLQPYTDPGVDAFDDDDDSSTALSKTAFVQRAVEITEQVAESRGMLSTVEGSLERANLPLRAGEALFFYIAVVVVVTIIGLVLTGALIGGLVLGGIAALVPIAVVNMMASRRRKAFLALLPDTLQLLSGTLRAGYSLMQGVEAVSQEVADPMGVELRRVVTEARLGRPLEESLDGVAERMSSADFAWAVMAIRIQREVGGNLSELLLTVGDTMTARERLRRDVAALTAEGRMSAIVLGALPILLGLVMFVLNKDYTSKLLTSTLGNILLGLSLLAMLIGFVWMKKIINIEI